MGRHRLILALLAATGSAQELAEQGQVLQPARNILSRLAAAQRAGSSDAPMRRLAADLKSTLPPTSAGSPASLLSAAEAARVVDLHQHVGPHADDDMSTDAEPDASGADSDARADEGANKPADVDDATGWSEGDAGADDTLVPTDDWGTDDSVADGGMFPADDADGGSGGGTGGLTAMDGVAGGVLEALGSVLDGLINRRSPSSSSAADSGSPAASSSDGGSGGSAASPDGGDTGTGLGSGLGGTAGLAGLGGGADQLGKMIESAMSSLQGAMHTHDGGGGSDAGAGSGVGIGSGAGAAAVKLGAAGAASPTPSPRTSWTVRTTSSIPTCDFTR
jgi:hypothetical protein